MAKMIWPLLIVLALGIGCGKRVIQSTPSQTYSYSQESAKRPDRKVPPPAPLKSETNLPGEPAGIPQPQGIKEETLSKEIGGKTLREEAAGRGTASPSSEKSKEKTKLQPVYFDFNQSIIREDQKEALVKDAEWLKASSYPRIRIEGNCDERGTAEYNLALGQKRAEAARVFLEGLGIPAKRMETISYGLERPVDRRHDEDAWSKNRRVDLVPVP